ncbi:MAG: NifU family protein [Saprospiraceae bacterium]|nr:NifU family protein [Saprospiraceae bacterium]
MSDTIKKPQLDEIDKVLDVIRPHLAVDGGNIEVIDITDDMTVKIKWVGNCINCSMSTMTMKAGVEHTIKSKFPEIKAVEAVNGLNA